MIPADWQPHHRDDGELIGYVVAEENGLVVPVNLVGHPIGDAMDRFAAEELLEDAGLSYLAEPWLLRHDDGTEQRVVIVEVEPTTSWSPMPSSRWWSSPRTGHGHPDRPTDRLRPA